MLPSALIVYPADIPSTGTTRLHIRDSRGMVQARLHAFGIDIPSMLDDLFSYTAQKSAPVLRDAIKYLLN